MFGGEAEIRDSLVASLRRPKNDLSFPLTHLELEFEPRKQANISSKYSRAGTGWGALAGIRNEALPVFWDITTITG